MALKNELVFGIPMHGLGYRQILMSGAVLICGVPLANIDGSTLAGNLQSVEGLEREALMQTIKDKGGFVLSAGAGDVVSIPVAHLVFTFGAETATFVRWPVMSPSGVDARAARSALTLLMEANPGMHSAPLPTAFYSYLESLV